jgi:putative glycerol-1-phosphate prenyltransferase
MPGLTYDRITDLKSKNKKGFTVLVDPDKTSLKKADELIALCTQAKVDFIFVGGSLVVSDHLEDLVQHIKSSCDIPVLLFPGSPSQITPYADALLYLSLISGRNPELLIGQHVISAPSVRKSGLEVIPTGYMLIDGGAPTTVSYISNASPIPSDKNEIALCTALAGEMLGLKLLYMDAGSGAKHSVKESMIQAVASHVNIPLIIGGGIVDPEKAYNNCKAGADIIVVGNAIEKDSNLITEISQAVHSCSVIPSPR